MSKALAVLKLFFSMVSLNSTAKPDVSVSRPSNTTFPITQAAQPIPLLLKPMHQVSCFVGQGFRFKIPDDTFYPTYYTGRKDNLKLSMLTINEGKISQNSWLRFDANTRKIYGFPLAGNEGKFDFLVRASNSDGKTAEDTFRVHVRKNSGEYNHEFVLRTGFSLVNFLSDVMVRFEFTSRFARFAVNGDVSSVWFKSYNKKYKELKFVLGTVPYTPCEKALLQNIHNKLTMSSGRVQSSFAKALSEKYPVSSVGLNLFGPCSQKRKEDGSGFEWGILKHLIPILMLMFVIGIPVGISYLINKRIKKKRAKLIDERKKRKRMENGMGFTFHTVHYNNRYPSMLSVSNNSREEEITEDERSSSSKLNTITNGSTLNGKIPSSVNLEVPSPGLNKQTNIKINTNVNTRNLESRNLADSFESGSRVVYMGKSDMNIPVYFTKPKEEVKNDSDLSFSVIAESISATLKGIGKSMWNITGQSEEASNTPKTKATDETERNNYKGNKLVLKASELELPLAVGKKDRLNELQSVSIIQGPATLKVPNRSQSEMKLTEYGQSSHGNSGVVHDSLLMNYTTSRLPKRRVSLPHIEIHSPDNYPSENGENVLSQENQKSSVGSGVGDTLKGVAKPLTDVSKDTATSQQTVEVDEDSAIYEATSQMAQMSKDARDEFETLAENVGGTEERDIQYSVKHSRDYEKRYINDDEDELITAEDIEAMDYTTWRKRQIKKAQRAKKRHAKENIDIFDTECGQDEYHRKTHDGAVYQDYTNPYQYVNGSCLTSNSQSVHLTSQSSGMNWSDDYEKENRYKQQPSSPLLLGHNTQSMPCLNDGKYSYEIDSNKVDNRSKTREDQSLLGKLFSREKPKEIENRNLNEPEKPDESLVGFLKTRVAGFLGPSDAGSSWFK